MPFGSLWMPTLLSAVAVWLASAVFHMVLKHHRADYKGLPDEGAAAAALGKGSPAPGLYFLPHCPDPAQMKDPAVVKRFTDGPVALIAIMKCGPPALGRHLAQWFGFCLLISFVTSYVARHTLLAGMNDMTVMRLTGSIAFVGYGLGSLQDSIWHGVPWSNTARLVADAVVYAILTGLCFMLLWPD